MRILKGNDVTIDMLKQALKLDWSCYPKEYWLTLDKCKNYFSANSEIYIVITDKDELIGYINFSPITDEAYKMIESGSYKDTCLEGKDIVPYDRKGYYNGYFSSIVVKEKYRNKNIAAILMKELFVLLTELAERGIFFSRIVADVLSDGGKALLEKFGLKKITSANNQANIYEAHILPPDENLEGTVKELYDIYRGMNDNE